MTPSNSPFHNFPSQRPRQGYLVAWHPGLAIAAVLTAAAIGCSAGYRTNGNVDQASTQQIQVVVGLPPYAYLVQRIGRERTEVSVLLQSGRDPHSFALSPRQSVVLARCQLLVIAGMPFERAIAQRLHRAANLRVIDVAEGLRTLPAGCSHSGHAQAAHEHAEPPQAQAGSALHPQVPPNSGESARQTESAKHDQHGPASPAGRLPGHAHTCQHCGGESTVDETMDPHVWLSPPLLKRQAERIAVVLSEIDPENAIQYRANLESLLADLDILHQRIAERLQPFRGRAFYVFHPAFGYFAACYGLRQVAVEHGGKPPTQRQLRELIHQASEDRPRTIFVQPQYDSRSARVVAEAIGAEVAVVDDLAPDVLANIELLAEKIAAALEAGPNVSRGDCSP